MAKQIRLTEERIARLQAPATGEVTFWDAELRRFGVRMRAGGSGKAFVVKYRAGGRQRKLMLGSWPATSVAAARKRAREILGDVERGQDPAAARKSEQTAPIMADLAGEYLQAKAATKRPKSLRDDRDVWTNIVLPILGRRRVKDVTAREIEELHRANASRPYRANRMLALLNHAFTMAVRWSWRTDNPAAGIERYREEPRERYLTADEMARLIEVLNDHPNRRAANAVRMLLLTGARRGEVLEATWEQFDLAAGTWTKPSAHTKQKKVHRVPLSAPARALLVTMREEADRADVPSPYLFPGDVPGQPLGDIKNFWLSVCRRAGIEGARLHDLRHQYASILASAGLSLPIIGRLLGHTQAQTTARYAHLFDDPLRAATERVGALVENAGKSSAEVIPLRKVDGR